jgi:hypothetical protein
MDYDTLIEMIANLEDGYRELETGIELEDPDCIASGGEWISDAYADFAAHGLTQGDADMLMGWGLY